MEAVPRLYMLSFDLKVSPSASDFLIPLQKYIASYYQEDPESYRKEIKDIEILRQAARKVPQDFTGCSILKRYFSQLLLLQNRFPMTDEGPACVGFTWTDIYSGKTFTITDIKYEQACILYNIGALHSQLGSMDVRNDTEGMKVTCCHFQCAAWAFQHLRDTYPQPKGSDLSHDILTFVMNIMLAQAQECIMEKSMLDCRKSSITAKVTIQVVDYYRAALTILDSSSPTRLAIFDVVGTKLYKNWEQYVEFKMAYYSCISHYFMGNSCEEQQKMGERVSWYQSASEHLTKAIKIAKKMDREDLDESLLFLRDVIGGKHNASKKENDFVYHEKVLPVDSLPEIKGASLVKAIPFNPSDPEVSGSDIFSRLIPMEAHSSSSVYSEEKATILRSVKAKIEEKNEALSTYMSSLHLDKSILSEDEEQLSQELMEKCASMSVKPDAIPDLFKLVTDLEETSAKVEADLGSCKTILSSEEQKEKEHQTLFGKRAPSMITMELKKESSKFDEAHLKAMESNKFLKSVADTHIANLQLLSGPLEDVKNKLPSVNSIKTGSNESSYKGYQKLLNKVEEMQKQRVYLEEQLRESLQKDDITQRIVAVENKDDMQKIFDEELKKHDQCLTYIEQNLTAQDNILQALTDANAKFADVRSSLVATKQERLNMIQTLIASYEAYEDLVDKAKSGLEFYQKLKTNVSRLLDRIKSVTKVQDEERSQRSGAVQKRMGPAGPTMPPAVKNSAAPKLKDYLPYMTANTALPTVANLPASNLPGVSGTNLYQPASNNPHMARTMKNIPQPAEYAGQQMLPNQVQLPAGVTQMPSQYPAPHALYRPQVPVSAPDQGQAYARSLSFTGFPQQNAAAPIPGHNVPAAVHSSAGNNQNGCQNHVFPSNNFPNNVQSYNTPTSHIASGSSGATTNISSYSMPASHTMPVSNMASSRVVAARGMPVSTNYGIPQSSAQAMPVGHLPSSAMPVNSVSNEVSGYSVPSGDMANYTMTAGSSSLSHTNMPNQNIQGQNPVLQGPVTNQGVPSTMLSRGITVSGASTYGFPTSGTKIQNASPLPVGDNSNNSASQAYTSSAYSDTTSQYTNPYTMYHPGTSSQYATGYSYNAAAAIASTAVTPAVSSNNISANVYAGSQTPATGINASDNQQSVQYALQNYMSSGYNAYNLPASYPVSAAYPSAASQNTATYQQTVTATHIPSSQSYPSYQNQNSVPCAVLPQAVASYSQAPFSHPIGMTPTSQNNGCLQEELSAAVGGTVLTPIIARTGSLDSQNGVTNGVPKENLSQTSVSSVANGSETTSKPKSSSSNIVDTVAKQDIKNSMDSSQIKEFEKQLVLKSKEKEEASPKDPLDDPNILIRFSAEIEKFEKLVEGLVRKSLNGTTPLDQKWKELAVAEEKDSRKMSISVARCYPLKNRVPDIMPYDSNRVKLLTCKDDYINASCLKDLLPMSPTLTFVITQAPLPATYSDFWMMIWEQQVENIVCLQSTAELKSHIYWPQEKGRTLVHGPLELSLQSQKASSCFVARIITVTHTKNKSSRVVVHLQFNSWQPSKFPEVDELVSFVTEVLSYYRQQRSLQRPLVVHCSAGVGRSGAFCLITALASEMNSGQGPKDLVQIAARMFQQRKFIIQDKDHLQFCYHVVLGYAQKVLMKRGILVSRPSFEDKSSASGLTSVPDPFIDVSLILKMQPATSNSESDVSSKPQKTNNSSILADSCTSEYKEVESSDINLTKSSCDTELAAEDTIVISTDTSEAESTDASVTSVLDPSKFTLDAPVASSTKRRITKDMFSSCTNTLVNLNLESSDPLSQLDPLWSLKK